MTDGLLDLHDLLAALEPHGWRMAESFQGLYRPVKWLDPWLSGMSTIRATDVLDRFIYQESWAGKSPTLSRWPDRKEGTAVEILAHLVAGYADAAREAA